MARSQTRYIASHISAGQGHLHDEVMQHHIVQHRHPRTLHRLPVDELVMGIVAKLIDRSVEVVAAVTLERSERRELDPLRERRQKHRRVVRDAGAGRGEWREERYFHSTFDLRPWVI